MERLSIFDIFKIGVGPSSSHTLGPWKAALDFAADLKGKDYNEVEVHLYGSLSKTGKGHAKDTAVQLGLAGYDSTTVPTENISDYLFKIRADEQICINQKVISFAPTKHIFFNKTSKKAHPNTVIFKAFKAKNRILKATYYSVGGGFIEKKGSNQQVQSVIQLPYPIDKGKDLLKYSLPYTFLKHRLWRLKSGVWGG